MGIGDSVVGANARLMYNQLGIGEDFSNGVKRQLAKHAYELKGVVETEAPKHCGGHNVLAYYRGRGRTSSCRRTPRPGSSSATT